MKKFLTAFCILSVSACNSVYIKPNTLDTNALIYAQRGGFSMQRSLKEELDKRGYKTTVGILKSANSADNKEFMQIPNKARYAIRVKERKEILRPLWCVFNGFWWWNFELSISDRKNGLEILSWRGRGCANSSIDKLNQILDELEIKKDK